MTCCLLVGTKSGRLKYQKKKLFLVSLLAHLILMNMLRLNALFVIVYGGTFFRWDLKKDCAVCLQ